MTTKKETYEFFEKSHELWYTIAFLSGNLILIFHILGFFVFPENSTRLSSFWLSILWLWISINLWIGFLWSKIGINEKGIWRLWHVWFIVFLKEFKLLYEFQKINKIEVSGHWIKLKYSSIFLRPGRLYIKDIDNFVSHVRKYIPDKLKIKD